LRGKLQNNEMTQLTQEGSATDRPPVVGSTPAAATVLVVEDEIVVSFFIRMLFEERGLQVAVASTAAEALQLIESLGSTLGAAIIDIGLPDGSGDRLVAPIRAVLPELPIVIATGFSQSEYDRRPSSGRCWARSTTSSLKAHPELSPQLRRCANQCEQIRHPSISGRSSAIASTWSSFTKIRTP
jgi:CheY-like chemotaxis protein